MEVFFCFINRSIMMRAVPPSTTYNSTVFDLAFYISDMQQSRTCLYSKWLYVCTCMYRAHKDMHIILSSVFKLGLSCVISKYLTICGHFSPPSEGQHGSG